MKRLTRKQKEEKAVVDLINEMFKIAGHEVTYDDIKDRKDNWFQQWTMTLEQNDEWNEWGKKYFMKHFRILAKSAEREMQWVNLMWGLKLKDFVIEN
jgi:hypothetical protein